jgi:hypothetical protein
MSKSISFLSPVGSFPVAVVPGQKVRVSSSVLSWSFTPTLQQGAECPAGAIRDCGYALDQKGNKDSVNLTPDATPK